MTAERSHRPSETGHPRPKPASRGPLQQNAGQHASLQQNPGQQTPLQRFYLREVLSGLALTAAHFFRNMRLHAARAFGRKDAHGAVTIQYPEERRPYSPRLRSLHRLVRREDGSPRCVACMMCETVCPARCIYIIADEHPNPEIEKMPARFDIDLGKCVFCGFCVEACPEDAIRMDTGILEFSSYSRGGMIYTKETLLSLEPAGPDGVPTSPVPIPATRTVAGP